MTLHDISASARFVLLAVATIIIGSLVVLFAPLIYSETVYFNEDVIMWTIPMKNFWLLGLALIVLVMMWLLLAWRRNRWTYVASVVLFIATCVLGYASFLSVTFIREAGIEQRDVFKTHVYQWEDIEKVTLTYNEKAEDVYTFTPKNGEPFTLEQNQRTASAGLQTLFSTYGVAFEEREQ
jgi:thiol:disulfide interchange protein